MGEHIELFLQQLMLYFLVEGLKIWHEDIKVNIRNIDIGFFSKLVKT